MIMKRIASLALSLVLLLGCLPAALAAEGPSSWAEEEVNRAVEVGLVPQSLQGDWQQPVTRGEFAMLVIRYLAVTYGRTDEQLVNDYMTYCPDRNGEFWGGEGLRRRAYIQSAYHMGLVNGKGDGTVYDPEGAITRQEAACLLARAYEKLDPEDHRVALYSSYTDYSAMATWAVDSISSMVGLGIMGSTSTSALTFEPLGTYSREQAAVTFLRLYEDAPVSAVKGNVIKLEEAAYQRAVWNALHKLGVADSQVRFRADTPYGSVLALEYSGMMQFYETLLFIPKDGQTVTLSGQSAGENWTLSADQTTLTYTIDGTVHTADLTT